MKCVLLAGSLSTRLQEETIKAEAMVEIGGKPPWHIMKMYSSYGINEFVVCCGYKGYVIKEYFSNYFLHNSDVTFDMSKSNRMTIHSNSAEPWSVTLIDTGETSNTGGRLRRVKAYLDDGDFCFNYGDGVSDVNINEVIQLHKSNGLLATVTAVRPPGRYGSLCLEENQVYSFKEKPEGENSWINGGFCLKKRSY